MLWGILSVLAIIAIVGAMNSGKQSRNEAAVREKLTALADIMGSQSAFLGIWRWRHQSLLGSPLPEESLNSVVAPYWPRHQEIAESFRSITANNYEILGPSLERRSDLLDEEIAARLGTDFFSAWQAAGKNGIERIDKAYMREQLGLHI